MMISLRLKIRTCSLIFKFRLSVCIRIVVSCVALSCQAISKLKRSTPYEFTIISANIFIHCCAFVFYIFDGLYFAFNISFIKSFAKKSTLLVGNAFTITTIEKLYSGK